SDYEQLGYNLRSNLCQGGPLKTRSLTQDSYTPDIIEKAVRDPKNWHGRRIYELGRWYEKYFLDLNVMKAMKEKYG
ncbi:TEX33 protein, partial [Atrichornis clamosus]|nr:TEX33 protein [Atrichornis clamosus]